MEADLAKLNAKILMSGEAEECYKGYSVLKSDEERFRYTLELLEKYEITPVLQQEEKSSIVSASHRKTGNELFVSPNCGKRRNEILELYTKSVAYAQTNSQELAFAYGNRSALFFEARLYEHCLRDIDRALALDYPEHLKTKLLKRRDCCTEALDEMSELQTAKDFTNCVEKNKKQDRPKNQYAVPRKLFDETKYAPPIPVDNPEIPGVSRALEIAYSPQFGRYVRATRRIFPGEVLAVHKGYASVLAPENAHTHCDKCLSQTWSSVSCVKCVDTVYCDEDCRSAAWHDHHEFECGVKSVLVKHEMNVLGLLSMRLVVRAVKEAGGLAPLKERLESQQSCEDPRTAGFTGTPSVLDETDYLSVYHLSRNTEQRSIPDLFGRSVNTVYIVYCLGALSDFFGERFSGDINTVRKNPWSCLIGGLIVRHQQIIPTNGHFISETRGLFSHERGSVILPFFSLFNHSCDGALTRKNYGDKTVLYALQTIEAGEQVYDNYGEHYSVQHRQLRQDKLKQQFHFECGCRVCTENWPLFHAIPSWKQQKLDRTQKLKLEKALKNFNRYVKIALGDDVGDKLYMIKDLAQMLKVLFDTVKQPCQEINEITETLKRIYSLLAVRYQSLSD